MLPTSVPIIRLPSNGNTASGTTFFTRGRNANASMRRAGPRRSGARSDEPIRRLGSATTFRLPSGRRTAQAHEVGPCTSTPFTSAIPPSRILSSGIETGDPCLGGIPLRMGGCAGPKRGLERPRCGAGPAVTDGSQVHLDDGQHLAYRGRREGLVRAGEMLERVGALLDVIAAGRADADQRGTRDAGEDADLERGRMERVAVPPPDVRDRRLEDDVAVGEEDGVVRAASARLRFARHVDRIARRL